MTSLKNDFLDDLWSAAGESFDVGIEADEAPERQRPRPWPRPETQPMQRPQVLVLGDVPDAGQVATVLAPDGVRTIIATDGRDALSQLPELTNLPLDVLVLSKGDANDPTGTEVVRQLRSRLGQRPAVVVLGGSAVDDQAADAADAAHAAEAADEQSFDGVNDARTANDYLPADVGVARLADHVRHKLEQRLTSDAPRRALSTARLTEEVRRELHRSARSARQGMLTVVSVAEWPQLRRRFGSQAEQALAKAFDEAFAVDADTLEQHAVRSEGGFFLLMPEIDPAAGRDRLLRLSRQLAGTVIDVGGEHVHITPVIGYATFAGASSAAELREHASLAMADALQHLDLLPVSYAPAMKVASDAAVAPHDRLLALIEWLRSPVQVAFTLALLLCLPFIVYVLVWDIGFDLTSVTYPLVAVALAGTALVLWIECFRAAGPVDLPAPPVTFPTATAIVAAYLPNEAATIVDTVTTLLDQNYPGELQVILAYNTPQRLPIEETLALLAAADPRLQLLRVRTSTSKAQNVNAALAHVRGEFVGVFDADHHPVPGSFVRAWRWLAKGHDIVQGHCVVRNGDTSWVARLIAVEFETIYAVSHPGRARLHGFGIFGGSNGYWRTSSLRQIRMHGAMLTEDIDSSMRSLLDGFSIVSDPGLKSTELAPTTVAALWNQRMRWAQGWTQTSLRHLRPSLRSKRLSLRQKIGAGFLLGWTQVVPWVTIQVIPILAFSTWRHGGFGGFNFFIPLFVLLTIFTLSVGVAQTVFAYVLGDDEIRRHRGWFVLYALHSTLWLGEFKNVISRVAQLKQLIGERQWRVTPRTGAAQTDTG